MAEIEIEKKSNNNWIWIVLGLVIIGVIIYFVVADNDEVDDDDMEQIESDEVGNIDTTNDLNLYGISENGVRTIIAYPVNLKADVEA